MHWSNGAWANDALVRSITKEAVQIDAPPRITGIASGFYSAGTVLGEGETQIFIRTESEQPMSLSVLSRPGLEKRWAVSTAEVIDESATAAGKIHVALVSPRLRPAAYPVARSGRGC